MIDYTVFTLDNGLRVVHNYDPSTAMVAVNTLYNVGSRDEAPGHTGLAHLFEHLMFGGSVHIPDFDAEMERAGGINNAYTSCDFTNFYDVAPAGNLETLLWLESDRMLGPAFTEQSLEVQRSVVIEEFKQTHLNRPYGDLWHKLRKLVYTVHPYRIPTIGETPEHIRDARMEEVKAFFFSHYAPNNAVLAVSGNVTLAECRRTVERWYSDLPERDIAPRSYLPEPEVMQPRLLTVRGHVPCAMVVTVFPMQAYGEDGYVEADLLTDILASGRSSRFFRQLLSNPLFAEADASIIGSEEPGMLILKARLAEGMEERADEALRLLTECAFATRDGVTPTEVERAVNRYVSNTAFSRLSVVNRAEALAFAEMHGEDVNDIETRYRAATTGSITRTACQIFRPERACTLFYLPD